MKSLLPAEPWRKNRNSFLMLGDCVGERLKLEVVLKDGSCKLVISPLIFAAMYYCSVLLRKNASLGKFYSLLIVDWACYWLVAVKGVAYVEN